MRSVPIKGIPITVGSYSEVVDNIYEVSKQAPNNYVCVLNVHMLVEAIKDPSFKKVVENAAIVTADGKPIVWALKWLYGIKQDRIAGMFLMQDLIKKVESKGGSVFFYGGAQAVLDEAETYLKLHHPNLKIGGFISPPFRPLTETEEAAYVKTINDSGANIVFVALGCPKQEKWMSKMQHRINAVTVGVGAAVPVLVGMRKKAPMWIQNAGLEWLFRLCLEPRRLFKRYAVTNSRFVFLLLSELIKIKVLKRKYIQAPLS